MSQWLSLTGIASLLQTTPDHIRWLVSNGYLEMIPGKNKSFENARFLDPTPQYAERLRLGEMIYQRRNPIEIDLSEKAIFTKAEVAAILGWSEKYAHLYLHQKKTPHVKIGPRLRLYTAKTVRDLLWRRTGRTTSKQRAPFLVTSLIDWFHRQNEAAMDGVPTDLQFAEDDALQKKLERVLTMPSPEKESALRELLIKTDIAKQVALCIAAR